MLKTIATCCYKNRTIGLSALKTATKKVAHKAAEANSRNVEKIIITPKKVKKY